MDGIIPLRKERGMTSFDCVSKLRKIVHMKKVGHSGTLDPNVDGVLPICLGSGTKVVNFLMASGKEYRGTITFGFSTTTEDLDGEVVKQKKLSTPFEDSVIQEKMQELVSEHLKQIPPMFSAVKVNGRRLYDYARAGETVERPVRYVQVHAFDIIGKSEYNAKNQTQTFKFKASCGKGTYVRTLAIMLGELLNCPATMTSLTRTKSGHFDLSQTYTLAEINQAKAAGKLAEIVYPIDHALKDYPKVALNDEQWQVVQNGGFLNQKFFPKCDKVAVSYKKQVKALYEPKKGTSLYGPFKMFSNK